MLSLARYSLALVHFGTSSLGFGEKKKEVRYTCVGCFAWFDDSWRITLWRILLYLEGIAILGDFAILWSLDYDALALG